MASSKETVCSLYRAVDTATTTAGNKRAGDDPASVLAVAVNIRLALLGGGSYLLDGLAKEPATPPDLSHAVRDLAEAYQRIAIAQLSDKGADDVTADTKTADEAAATIQNICK